MVSRSMQAAMVVSAAVTLIATVAPRVAQADAGAGVEAIERYGCALCHETPHVEARADQSCVACHQRVQARARGGFGLAPQVEHLLHTPSLGSAARRLRPEYLRAFIKDPHDVRPALGESMPRLPVTDDDAAQIVSLLLASNPPALAPTSPEPMALNVARGRQVFVSQCASCHAFGNLNPGYELPPAARNALGTQYRMAPNLRHVEARMDPDVALAWIRDPQAWDEAAEMPRPTLSEADALAVRDFLYLGDPGEPASVRALSEITPLERPVRFAEVRHILGRSCIHCHAHTTASSLTSLGFEPTALDLSSYDGVMAGALLPNGSRRSIVEGGPAGAPPLLERLRQRHREASRDFVARLADPLTPTLRGAAPRPPVGMPLGLPPVSDQEMRVIASWIAQGTPP